jgi:hypothetical protein
MAYSDRARFWEIVNNNVPETVNALYSYMMDLFDEQVQMDDSVPMAAQTPSAYTVTHWNRL